MLIPYLPLCSYSPMVSSIVYLSGGDGQGGPTLVLDQRLDDDVTAETRGWLVRPSDMGFMTFSGDRLHGVLPSKPRSANKNWASGRRLTLMIGWWSLAASVEIGGTGHRHGPGPQCAIPRIGPSCTWPKTLGTGYESCDSDTRSARDLHTDHSACVQEISSAWEPVAGALGEPTIELPSSIDQVYRLPLLPHPIS